MTSTKNGNNNNISIDDSQYQLEHLPNNNGLVVMVQKLPLGNSYMFFWTWYSIEIFFEISLRLHRLNKCSLCLHVIYYNLYYNQTILTNILHFLDVTANRVFGPLTKVILSKDGSGLGFSLDGGKNSPTGDQPLTVKKIFTGQ